MVVGMAVAVDMSVAVRVMVVIVGVIVVVVDMAGQVAVGMHRLCVVSAYGVMLFQWGGQR